MLSLLRNASKARLGEKVTRRDLLKMGLVTAGGVLVAKNVSSSAKATTATPTSSLRAGAGRTKSRRVAWRTRVTVIEA